MRGHRNAALPALAVLVGWLVIAWTPRVATAQAVIFSEAFDSAWSTANSDLETPGFGFWTSTGSGDTEWHRDDYTVGWTSGLGAYAPGGADGTAHSARFHSRDAAAGMSGRIETPWFPIWNYPGPRALSFWYINTSGTDSLFVYRTHDGFNQVLVVALGTAGAWTKVWVNLGMGVGFSSMRLRFEAVSDDGDSDIGLDQVSLQQGIAGTIRVGQDHPETPRLTEAFAMLDSATAMLSSVRIEMDDSYNNTIDTELLPLTLVSVNSSLCAPCSVWVGPGPGASTKNTSGSSSSAVIRLAGADNVVLDGRPGGVGTTGAWTVANTNPAAGTAAVWLSSLGAGQGASGNTIRNLTLSCGSNTQTSNAETFGVIGSGAAISASSDGLDNDLNRILFNDLTACRTAIHLRGALANRNDGNAIVGNTVGPTGFGPGQIGRAGIVAQHQTDVEITDNEVRFVGVRVTDTAPAVDVVGIGVGANVWPPAASGMVGARVERNDVHDLVNGKGLSAVGIVLASSALPSNNLVANNSVRDVVANGLGTDQAVGIGVGPGDGERVVFNSIRGWGDLDPPGTTTATQSAVGLRVASASAANLTVQNNVMVAGWFSNNAALGHYGIVVPSTGFAWGTGGLDHNDYSPDPVSAQATLGGIGTTVPYTPVTTLNAWRTQFTPNQDGASVSEAPPFLSASDLHLVPGSPTALESGGVPITGVPGDFDGDLRNLLTPDIGFDEGDFTPPCRAPVIRDIADIVPRWGRTMRITVIAHDPDDDPLTFSALNLPPGASINGASGVITWNLPACPGAYGSITVIATDPCGAADSTSFGVHPLPVIAANCYVPQSWIPKLTDYPADANEDFIEDMLLAPPAARRPGLRVLPNDSVDVFLYFNRCNALVPPDRDTVETYARVLYEPDVIAAALVRTTPARLLKLAGLPFVAMVGANHSYRGALNTSVRSLRVRPSATFSPATVQDSFPGIDGSGVIVAILDSGVDENHESTPLSACASGVSFIMGTGDSTSGQPPDPHGHGTHSAGAAVGRGDASGDFSGPAPRAAYSDVRVLVDDGAGGLIGSEADVIAALQYAFNALGPWRTVVYLGIEGDPLGYGADPSIEWTGTDALSNTIEGLSQNGLMVVVPVGNTDVNNTPLLPPAVAEGAIVVAASAHMGNVETPDSIAAFSKSGPRTADTEDQDASDEEIPHVAAPGTDLPSGGTGIVSAAANTGNQYVALEGTSVAAAQVAGIVALMQQLYNGSLGATEARNALILGAVQSAPPQVPGGTWNAQWGHGAVDAFRVLDLVIPQSNPGFDVFCYRPQGNWFLSPDIGILDQVLLGDSVRIAVSVHNKGGRRMAGYTVDVGAYNFGNSPFQGTFFTFASTDTLMPGEYEAFQCKWYVNPGMTEEHGCIKADISYERDGNPADNCANHNVDIENLGSSLALSAKPALETVAPARFTMFVANLLPEAVNVTLVPTVVEGSDWTLTSSETTFVFTMVKYEAPREVTFDLTPGASASDSFVVDVEVLESGTCAAWSAGGGRLVARLGGPTGVEGGGSPGPALVLGPRPFREKLNITFALPAPARAGLRIYDVSGRKVHEIDLGEHPAGVVRAQWDGRLKGGADAPPGVYFIRIHAGHVKLGDRVVRLQ